VARRLGVGQRAAVAGSAVALVWQQHWAASLSQPQPTVADLPHTDTRSLRILLALHSTAAMLSYSRKVKTCTDVMQSFNSRHETRK